MKKLISVLVVIALCFAFTTMAFAAEEADLGEVVGKIADQVGEGDVAGAAETAKVNADALYNAFGDILESTGTVKAKDAIDEAATAISDITGADMSNVKDTIETTLADYDLADLEIVDSSEVAGFVDKILERLEDLGIDTTPLIDALQNSKVGNAVIGIYTGEEKTEPEIETTTTEEPTTEEPTTIPGVVTGTTSSFAAVAVLAVAAVGAIVCTKKKADNE